MRILGNFHDGDEVEIFSIDKCWGSRTVEQAEEKEEEGEGREDAKLSGASLTWRGMNIKDGRIKDGTFIVTCTKDS